MTIRTYEVEVNQIVRVTLDDAKFDDAFMQEFREGFYPFFTIADHVDHIAQLVARGIHEPSKRSSEFIEGYGPSSDMGITGEVLATYIENLGEQP